jgi:hypothetical protein
VSEWVKFESWHIIKWVQLTVNSPAKAVTLCGRTPTYFQAKSITSQRGESEKTCESCFRLFAKANGE